LSNVFELAQHDVIHRGSGSQRSRPWPSRPSDWRPISCATGRLVGILDRYCAAYEPFHIYYSSRHLMPAKLRPSWTTRGNSIERDPNNLNAFDQQLPTLVGHRGSRCAFGFAMIRCTRPVLARPKRTECRKIQYQSRRIWQARLGTISAARRPCLYLEKRSSGLSGR
jgi:hypothetical protein